MFIARVCSPSINRATQATFGKWRFAKHDFEIPKQGETGFTPDDGLRRIENDPQAVRSLQRLRTAARKGSRAVLERFEQLKRRLACPERQYGQPLI